MPTPQTHRQMVQAVQLHQQGHLDQAERAYRQVLMREPGFPDALHLLGLVNHQRGQSAQAIELITRAITARPNVADFHVNLAEALRATSQLPQAIEALRRAIALSPNLPEAHANLASALGATGDLPAAMRHITLALQLRPQFPEGLVTLGNLLQRATKPEQAVVAFEQAIALRPQNAEAWCNLANSLQKSMRPDDALQAGRRAVQLKPTLAQAWNNLANAYQDLGLLPDAEAAYRKAIDLRPDDLSAHSNLLYSLCHRDDLTPEAIAAQHRTFGLRHSRSTPLAPHHRSPSTPLRVGYLSPDFRQHSVAYFIEPLLSHHDPAIIQPICYSDVQTPDAVTARLRSCGAQWHETRWLDDDELTALIRSHDLDILVDLAGHTDHNRMGVFARRAAPIQLSYLGYPNTTGLPDMDFRITDAIADPPNQTESLNTERLLRLPGCFLCYRPPADAPAPQRQPNQPLTFGSFNNFAKLTPTTLNLWARVLLAVNESRLLLKSRVLASPSLQQRLRETFQLAGVDPARILFAGWNSHTQHHLAAYEQLDIALDPLPYNGTTTTLEALWMGVPVITRAGSTHISRVGASILTAAGLPDLIAHDDNAFISIAATLAANPDRRVGLRNHLRASLTSGVLRDEPNFARRFETTLLQLAR